MLATESQNRCTLQALSINIRSGQTVLGDLAMSEIIYTHAQIMRRTAVIVVFSICLSLLLTISAYYAVYGLDEGTWFAILAAIIVPMLCSLPVGLYITFEGEKLRVINNELQRARKETENLYRKLKFDAAHDSMTGVLNRGSFLSILEARLENACDDVLLLVDVDNFKDINDRFGHHCGDEALMIICQLAQTIAGPANTVGRVGGDELALLLHDTGTDDGLRIAEDIRRAAEQAAFIPKAHVTHRLTVSIGLALLRQSSERYPLRKADIALYMAKGDGRNRVVVYEPSRMEGFADEKRAC